MDKLMSQLKALCDESRIKILNLLAQRELCACDFKENMDLTQPTISHHLSVLVETGLIMSEKRGRWCFYKINYDEMNNFLENLDKIINTKCYDIKLCHSDCDGNRHDPTAPNRKGE